VQKNKELLNFMNKFKLKSQFNGNTTKVEFQLDHIWMKILGNEWKFGVTYFPYFHKPIYIAFNLLQMYNKKPLMFPFI
jgi:hypothetical protein